MKIWLVSLFDPTPIDKGAVGRYIGIAQAADSRSIKVDHFTSTFRHTSKKHRFTKDTILTESENYTVRYLYSMSYTRNMSPARFYAHSVFAKKLVKDFTKLQKPDIILMSMPPISVAYEVSKWAADNDVPYVIDIIDPWPDSFIKDVPDSIKGFGRLLVSPFRNRLIQALEGSRALTAISSEYVNWAKSQSDKTKAKSSSYFFPAVDLEAIQRELSEINVEKDDRLTLVYAGSLASSYDIPSILEAAKYFEENHYGKTLFYIAGTGPQQELIESYAAKCSNINYLGWLNRNQLMEVYKKSDLGLIQHMNSLTQTVTYKLFSYLSAGIPVLNSLQSEMVQLIEENRVGLNNKEQNVNGLISNIEVYLLDKERLSVEKENALAFTRKSGDSKAVYQEMVDFLIQNIN